MIHTVIPPPETLGREGSADERLNSFPVLLPESGIPWSFNHLTATDSQADEKPSRIALFGEVDAMLTSSAYATNNA